MQGHFGDGTLIANDSAINFARVVNASGWIGMFAAPKLWAALRRIPPKAFLLELVDTYLDYAKSPHHYAYIPEDQRRPDLSLRAPTVQRLRELLRDWQPPHITVEIRDAAREVYLAEYGAPPKESWDETEHKFLDISLEATLVWPEGQWDETTFVAGELDNAPPAGTGRH